MFNKRDQAIKFNELQNKLDKMPLEKFYIISTSKDSITVARDDEKFFRFEDPNDGRASGKYKNSLEVCEAIKKALFIKNNEASLLYSSVSVPKIFIGLPPSLQKLFPNVQDLSRLTQILSQAAGFKDSDKPSQAELIDGLRRKSIFATVEDLAKLNSLQEIMQTKLTMKNKT